MFVVYILYSRSLKKFYTGYTSDIEQRMVFHNSGMNNFTSKGVPWIIIHTFNLESKSEALELEKKTKKNGAKRYLERNNIPFIL